MPKIALRYVGGDEAYAKSLEATNGVAFMEPVDAREVLASGNEDYEVDEDQKALIGQVYDPARMGMYPQLQGNDAELQTGHSVDKYKRDQVVKAVPDGSVPTASRPQTTTGMKLNGEKVAAAEPVFSAAAQDAGNADVQEGAQAENKPAAKKTARSKRT